MQASGAIPLLDVRELSVRFGAGEESLTIVDGISFHVGRAERVALVGESGSGKTMTAQAILRLNRTAKVGGSVLFEGRDLVSMEEIDLARVRGTGIGIAFQDAMTSLDPVMPIGEQVMETLVIHGAARADARRQALAILDELGIARAAERFDGYLHEFSGGMRQRIMLASALAGNPQLLLADEPTTALDVRVQQQVLDLLDDIAARRALSVLLITHDLGIVASFADRVLVMYAGRLVEDAPVMALFAAPLHPYTAGLLAAVPRIDRRVERLEAVPGTPALPASRPAGCAFHPRCPKATGLCVSQTPPMVRHGDRRVACHHPAVLTDHVHAA